MGTWKDKRHLWDTGCTMCVAGKHGSALASRTGVHHCIDCPQGKFNAAPGYTHCSACAAGTYQQNTGQLDCNECPSGKFGAKPAQAACASCLSGQFQNSDARTSCTPCATGLFAEGEGMSKCTNCPAGKFIGAEGSSACSKCGTGKHSSAPGGAIGCAACERGRATHLYGQADCAACIAGRYAGSHGSTACTACAAGQSQAIAGQPSCNACDEGYSQPTEAQATCVACSAGRFQPTKGQPACHACAPGWFGKPAQTGQKDIEHCSHCPHGKYQPAMAATTCLQCLSGKFGEHGFHGASNEGHCQMCPENTFTSEGGGTACKPCAAIDALRFQISSEGSTSCHDKKLDCLPGDWSQWGTCTKSCTPMIGAMKNVLGASGTHYRTRAKVSQQPCALPDKTMCNQAWGGGKACATFEWQQTQQCNEHPCPVNCETHDWSPWRSCSKTCGGGTSVRVRTIKVPPAHGGVACVLEQTSACNEGISCDKWTLPTCQQDHVHCNLRNHQLNQQPGAAGLPRPWVAGVFKKDATHPRPLFYYKNTVTGAIKYKRPTDYNVCAKQRTTSWKTTGTKTVTLLDGSTSTKRTGAFEAVPTAADAKCIDNQDCGLQDYGSCHECDTEDECADMGVHKTIFVTHHRAYMDMHKYDHWTKTSGRIHYQCRREGADSCRCTCNGHPPCVAKQGKLLSNNMLHANSYKHIPTLQDCCNLCTNHPHCGSWEFSSTGTCVLKAGAPNFIPQPAATLNDIDVWAGCRSGSAC